MRRTTTLNQWAGIKTILWISIKIQPGYSTSARTPMISLFRIALESDANNSFCSRLASIDPRCLWGAHWLRVQLKKITFSSEQVNRCSEHIWMRYSQWQIVFRKRIHEQLGWCPLDHCHRKVGLFVKELLSVEVDGVLPLNFHEMQRK